jgi:hypothetical protein
MLNVIAQGLETDLGSGRIWKAFERRRSVLSMMFVWMEVLTLLEEGRENSSLTSRRRMEVPRLK